MQIIDKFQSELGEFQPTMENAFFPYQVDDDGNVVFNRLKTVNTNIKINSVNGQFIAHTITLKRRLIAPSTYWVSSDAAVREYWLKTVHSILSNNRTDYKINVRIIRRLGEEGLMITITNTKRLISQPVGMALIEEIDKIVEKFIRDFSQRRDIDFIDEI